MQTDYTFIILTFNEEIHLPKLLDSIKGLQAPIFILDSGSTDKTLNICSTYQVQYTCRPFDNHPKQWHYALNIFPIRTPWVIGLDADQVLSPELYMQLKNFKHQDHDHLTGIYFNRKYHFRGRWIKHGGYFPKYMLKMFRYNIGYSDLSQNMDHRFLVSGPTQIWRKGYLIEENLKENNISFWLEKHNRYSDLLAEEEVNRFLQQPGKIGRANLWGGPNERAIWLKQRWNTLPRYLRPYLYFSFRLFFQKGILDGTTGILYHFLQAFWFRLIVDIKIEEQFRLKGIEPQPSAGRKFTFRFLLFFLLLYLGNLTFIGITTPGRFYNQWLDQHLNYIRYWREFNISSVATLLNLMGYEVKKSLFNLHVTGRAGFRLVYSCLGYGIMSVFTAFIMAYSKSIRSKLLFLLLGALSFQSLNLLRLLLITLYWRPGYMINLHFLFNLLIYSIMGFMIIIWIRSGNQYGNKIKKSL